MDWVHDRNNGSPETHFRFHEDSVFQMLGTFPEDDDLAAAIVHPEEANKLFLSPAAGNVPRRLRLPLEQNLLSELFLSA